MANERWCPPLLSGSGRNLVTMSVLTAPPRAVPAVAPGHLAVHAGHRVRPGRQGVVRHDVVAGRARRGRGAARARPSIRLRPAARASGRPGATSRPVSPSVTNSGMPPASVPITGTPHAWASRTLSPNGSEFDALTSTSSERSTAGTSSTGPTKRERSPSRARRLRPQLRPRRCRRRAPGAPTTARWLRCGLAVQHAHGPHHGPDALLGVDAADDADDGLVGPAAQPGPPRRVGRAGMESLRCPRPGGRRAGVHGPRPPCRPPPG